MATQVQFRRGTTTQNNAFTGAIGEITYDTDIKTLRLHDGTNAGGGAIVATTTASQTLLNKVLSTGSTWEGGVIDLAYGGTGAALTADAGGIVYSTADAMGISSPGASGQVLTSGGTNAPTWVNASSLTVGTSLVTNAASNIEGGSSGYLVYQISEDNTGFIAPGQSGYVLRSTGASTAPSWVTSAITIGTTPLQVGDTEDIFDGLDQLNATGTSHWTIPAGTTAQRPGTPADGMIRYNSTISSFEGYGPGGSWGSLGGVKDVDQDTYLLTEASAGSDEDTFEFYNAGTNTLSLDGTALTLKNDTYIQFDTNATAEPASHTEGALYYNNEYKALTYQNDISGSSLQIGLEEWVRVKNVTGSTITNGTPVYISGASGETPTIAPADATTQEKAEVLGIVTNDIANNTEGLVTTRGLVSGFDTSALTAGSRVHVGADGLLQTAAPTAPYFPTDVGTCIVSDASSGYIYVNIQEHTFEQFRVTGNTKMDGNLTIAGDLTVSGTQTITSQANLALDNAFIYMNSGDTIGEANTTFSGSGLDDAYFTGHFEGTSSTNFYVRIDGVGTGTNGVDTFEWSLDNFSTTEATGVDITGANQALGSNIKIYFNATTGHTSGDTWSGTAAPLNTDTGWASNRNTGTSGVGYTHIGVVWDTASNQMVMFDEYEPEIEGNIDTSHASFSYASLRIDDLTAVDANFAGNATITGTLGVSSTLSAASGSTIGNLTLANGSITDSSGTISFGNENLVTTGSLTAASLDISGSVDVDGTMEADAYTVNGTALNEYIADTVGAMVAVGNTESGISVTYQDADNTLDFDVNDFTITLAGDASGSATITNLASATLTVTVANDSHTHDGRYFTETESDARFARLAVANTFTQQQTFQDGFVNESPFNYVNMHVSTNTTLSAISGYQIKSGASTIYIDNGVTLTIPSGVEVSIG
jgi:hypothetical protein